MLLYNQDMKIAVLKSESKGFQNFSEKEWAIADQEHYGKNVDWKDKKILLKAAENGEIVGTLNGKVTAGVGYISGIITAKDKRGQGIGKQLMLKAEEAARSLGAHKIFLVTGDGWDAIKLYKSLGYEITAKLPNHFVNKDFIEMTKFI